VRELYGSAFLACLTYTHWMKRVKETARTTLEERREARKKYYDRRATPRPIIEIGDLAMLNTKNIKSTRSTRKFTSGLYSSLKVLEIKENRAFKLDIPARGKIHPVFHDSIHEPYKVSDPIENKAHERPRMSKVTWNERLKESLKVR